jgi:hypothetical protein
MGHLSAEDLARLVDEAPTAAEAGHLASCPECREEHEALSEQTSALASLQDAAPNAASWARLRARLRNEGLVRTPAATLPLGWLRHATTLRAAAAISLFVLGGATGALLQREAPLQPAAASPEVASLPVPTVRDAELALRAAEATYLAAMARYAQLSGVAPQTNPAARLAALEGIVLTTGAALSQAPADPVINGYHLAARAQRDAMLLQIADENDDDDWF